VPFTAPSLNTKCYVDIFVYWLTTMSLIWKCFSMLGFTLLTAAVSFRFGLIFQTVLPICPFSPTSRIACCSHLCLRFVFYLTESGLLYAVFYKTTCWQSPDRIRCLFQLISLLILKPVGARYVFRFIILLRIYSQFTSWRSTQITCQ